MRVVSFEDWKKNKAQNAAVNAHGGLKEDVAAREDYGFDLCLYISEETQGTPHNQQMWVELRELVDDLPREHAYFYFKAFDAYYNNNEDAFFENLEHFLESEKRIFGEIADCDTWMDRFLHAFRPVFPNFYERCAELFFKFWPLCALGFVCNALEQAESDEENPELELDLLTLAVQQDPHCTFAYRQMAEVYCYLKLWRSALPYFEKAAQSPVFTGDPLYYFDYAGVAEKAGKLELALTLYDACLQLDEAFPGAVNNLGCLYLRMERYQEASAQFLKAIHLKLDGTLPYKNMVALYEKQKKYEECIAFLEAHRDMFGVRAQREVERLAHSMQSGGENEQPPYETAEEQERKRAMERELVRSLEAGAPLFGRALSVYEDAGGYGRGYFLQNAGRIDLLLAEKPGGLVVAAVWGGTAGTLPLLRLAAQLDAVKKAHPFKKTRGALVASGFAPEARALLVQLKRADITLYEFSFEVRALPT